MASPDLSEFFKYSRPKQKPCALGFAREQLPPKERDALDAALADQRGLITSSAIRQWLSLREHAVNDASVTAHRRGVCSCGKS